jgi:spermidine/putrescine transport system ATP-binding protein
MHQIIVECHQLAKYFHSRCVLREINLAVRNGEFLTLLGPSGCGKTTLLRLIAGFGRPSEGTIHINGQDVTDLSPHQRPVGMVFQSYALFPHMTVYENIAFGLRCKHVPKKEINERVTEMLESVKLGEFARRKPSQLSGGQQQRVAIARAVVNKPLVLLLDEPLSSLDYRLRKLMQIELKQLQNQLNITFIFVTHDQEEALSMSDRIVVMHEGVMKQIGTPLEIYQKPQNLEVAKFIGELNLFDADIVTASKDQLVVRMEEQEFILNNAKNYGQKDKICVLIRPEDMQIMSPSMTDDIANRLPAAIEQIIYKGATRDVVLRLASQKIVYASQFFNDNNDKLTYTRGEKVWLSWKRGHEMVLPVQPL